MALIELHAVSKRFGTDAVPTWALREVSLRIAPGEHVALVGPSGSGKSTLMHLVCGIDRPTRGRVVVGGTDLATLDPAALTRWRGQHIGLVFQAFHLLPTMTAWENVMLPMELAGTGPKADRRDRAHALLARLGVADQADKLPADMSGGQQQRVALARALANDPPLVVADEPTGNLDSAHGEQVMAALAEVAAQGRTVLTVTHDLALARHATRRVQLQDGRVVAP